MQIFKTIENFFGTKTGCLYINWHNEHLKYHKYFWPIYLKSSGPINLQKGVISEPETDILWRFTVLSFVLVFSCSAYSSLKLKDIDSTARYFNLMVERVHVIFSLLNNISNKANS